MRFRKGGGRKKGVRWNWKGKDLEVKTFKYLGYVLQSNGRQEEHIKDRVRKGTAIMGSVEQLQERFLGWILGVDSGTTGYMVKEKMQRKKLRGRAEERAWNFEKKLAKGAGSEIARGCWREMKERERKGLRLTK